MEMKDCYPEKPETWTWTWPLHITSSVTKCKPVNSFGPSFFIYRLNQLYRSRVPGEYILGPNAHSTWSDKNLNCKESHVTCAQQQ